MVLARVQTKRATSLVLACSLRSGGYASSIAHDLRRVVFPRASSSERAAVRIAMTVVFAPELEKLFHGGGFALLTTAERERRPPRLRSHSPPSALAADTRLTRVEHPGRDRRCRACRSTRSNSIASNMSIGALENHVASFACCRRSCAQPAGVLRSTASRARRSRRAAAARDRVDVAAERRGVQRRVALVPSTARRPVVARRSPTRRAE